MEKNYDIYSKRDAFNGGTELVVFTADENRDGSFTKGSVLYEYLTDIREGEKFYTINQDDAEGNFIGYYDTIDVYYTQDDAHAAAERWMEGQIGESAMGCSVMEWCVLNGEVFTTKCVGTYKF
jgi:hypothetical protein